MVVLVGWSDGPEVILMCGADGLTRIGEQS